MSAALFRGDYEQLAQIAQRFGREQEEAQRMVDALQKHASVLQGGDWVGEGARAFYAEMNGDVLPSLKRLTKALQSAQRITAQISRAIKQAEDEAAAVLKYDGIVSSPAQTAPIGTLSEVGSGKVLAKPATSIYGDSSTDGTLPPQQAGPFHVGPPQRPLITHDNGFSDPALHQDPGIGDYAQLAKWKVMLEGSEALRPDLVDANAAYRHFLEGDGQDRIFSYERYVESDASGKTTLTNSIIDTQSYAEQLAKGQTHFSMSSDVFYSRFGDPKFPYPETENWQKTIGAYPFWTSADVDVITLPSGKRQFTMNYTLHAEDRYNFNPDSSDIATGIADSANGRFEQTGLANAYMHYGEIQRAVVWTEGDIPSAQITDQDTSRNRQPANNRRGRNRI